MGRPRTRSQGPLEANDGKEAKSTVAVNPSTAKRRMSWELQVRLEVLRLQPVHSVEGEETAQMQPETSTKLAGPMSATMRSPLIIPSVSRPNSVMGTQVSREVSTRFN